MSTPYIPPHRRTIKIDYECSICAFDEEGEQKDEQKDDYGGDVVIKGPRKMFRFSRSKFRTRINNISTVGLLILGNINKIRYLARLCNERDDLDLILHDDMPSVYRAMTSDDLLNFTKNAPLSRELVPQHIRDFTHQNVGRHGFGCDYVIKHCFENKIILPKLNKKIGVFSCILAPSGSIMYPDIDIALFTEGCETYDRKHNEFRDQNPLLNKKPWLVPSLVDDPLINTAKRCFLEEIGLDVSPEMIGVDIFSNEYIKDMKMKLGLVYDNNTFLIERNGSYTQCYILPLEPMDLANGIVDKNYINEYYG